VLRSKRIVLKDGRIALVRRARARDAEGVIAHVNEIAAERIYIMTDRLTMTVAEERAHLQKADGRTGLYLVATVRGRVVGTADIWRGRFQKNRHVANLGIAIRKEARGVGLGQGMMAEMIAWARSAGVRKLTLGVFASNAPALALYRQLGFAPEGRLAGQVILRGKPVDELLMARRL